MAAHTYDVAVIGAGPGGSAAAHYLAEQGKDVLLLDKADFPRDKTCGDGLTPRALHILADMDILPEAEQVGFRVNGISVYARHGATLQADIPQHPDFPNYLLVVPRLKLDDLIRRRAVASGANFESPVRATTVTPDADGVEIAAETQGKPVHYRARVAIAAIGANMGMLKDIGLLNYKPRPIVAVRAYYEGMQGLDDRIQAHFEQVPMPGYGWIFPIGPDSANVGLGMWREQAAAGGSLRTALNDFLEGARLKPLMAGARLVGAIKSYPLRIDFTTAPTYGQRILLVGEAAGLVSPLTGEGIDFALESGKLAAEFLGGAFAAGSFARPVFAGYDQLLRSNFQSIFRSLGYLRRVYVNPLLMDRIVRLCERVPEVKQQFVGILMGQQHPVELLRPRILRQVLMGV
jgi:geranylgeranyl reductase family protein